MLSLATEIPTPYHRWPAGPKLLAVCVVTALLFSANEVWLSALACALLLALYALPGRIFFVEGLRRLRGLWPFFLLLAIWHGVTGTMGTGLAIALRLFAAVGLANLVTMTTRLDALADQVIWAASPLRHVGLRPERIGLALALVLRFTPILTDRGARLIEAWRARSPRRAAWPVLAPFAVTAIDDATQVAEALRARGGIDGLEE